LEALHRLGVNGPNAKKIVDAGATTEVIRNEADAVADDPTVNRPARLLASRLMDRFGVSRRRQGGNTTTVDESAMRAMKLAQIRSMSA
jgi:hypothetical protein